MRALFGIAVLALSLGPAAVGAEPALTLNGPPATRFNHPVDLTGRLSPAVPGARVRLYRSKTFIGSTAVRRNGSYRFHLRLGRPGPFHAVARGISSPPLTVRIHPLLETALAGPRVAGRPLRFTARVRPQDAGGLRVRVLRNGEEAFARTFAGRARIHLGTPSVERIAVTAETMPARGYATVSRRIEITLHAPTLGLGSQSSLVAALLQRLAALRYATPVLRSDFDEDVLQSVYAFQKAQGLPRTGVADAIFWRRLDRPRAVLPRYRLPARHLEVDKTRQILLVVRGGRVALVVPVSTAGIAGYYTPEGRFAIGRKIPGYDPSPLGVLYKPMYFYGGYAIHGNPSVPPYPASHGCVRVPNFVIERLYVTEPYGETVFVYSS